MQSSKLCNLIGILASLVTAVHPQTDIFSLNGKNWTVFGSDGMFTGDGHIILWVLTIIEQLSCQLVLNFL